MVGIRQQIVNLDIRWLLCAAGELLLGCFLAAERWRRLAVHIGIPIRISWAVRATFAGLFIGQFLPATIGSDGARLWFLWRAGRPLRNATTSIVLDRMVALLGILALIIVSLPRLVRLAAPDMVQAAIAAAVFLGIGVAVFLLFDFSKLLNKFQGRRLAPIFALLNDIRRSLLSVAALMAIALSVVIQLLSVAAVISIAAALRLDIGFGDAIGIVSTAILLAAIPVSINGWGVREGAMVAGFALIGIAPQGALLISILFGLAAMMSALPGSVLWLTVWKAK